MNCIICDNHSTLKSKLYDDRYGYHGYFEVFVCNACGHKFLNADFSNNELTSLYTDYYPRSTFDVTKYKPAESPHGFR